MVIEEERGNHHFEDEEDTHTSSRTYEENGYGLNLDLLTIVPVY